VSPVTNAEIAAVFNEMADLLEIQGGDKYRIRAFRRSGRILETLPEPAHTMIRFNRLDKKWGVGEGTLVRVKQILRSGTCDDHARLKSQLPSGLREILEVKGVGPKTARLLWSHLRIGTVDQLDQAARSGRLATLPRFGFDRIDTIIRGVAAWRKRTGRLPLWKALRSGEEIAALLRELPECHKAAVMGSARRRKATIGDLDILVAADSRDVIAGEFVRLPQVAEVLIHGTGRCQVRLQNRQQVDLRVIPLHNWGAGMHYFTGSKLHNIAIRARAKRNGIRISDHGVSVYDTRELINPCPTEEEVFAAVGLPWIPPELRENVGEIEAAARGELPVLLEKSDLRGDLHMHTTASDGKDSVREMAEQGKQLGYEYISITEHSKTTTVANGLDEARLLKHIDHIHQVDAEIEGIRVLAGIEVDILPDGRLDFDARILSKLDWVVASVHSDFHFPIREMTERVVRAMETGLVDCIGHPTGRKIGSRPGYKLDMDRVLKAARRLDVAMEVNGNPARLDLDDIAARQCREYGVPVVVNSDAHAAWQMTKLDFGVWTARRGWLEKRHVLNSYSWDVIAQRRLARMRKHGVQVSSRLVVKESSPVPAPQEAVEALIAPDTTLIDELAVKPLSDDLKIRLDRFMKGGGDEPLERALQSSGQNAIQAAFNLLNG